MHRAHLAILVGLSACLLSACGAAGAPGAQVESAPASGEVAGSVPQCDSAPPARAPLKDSKWTAHVDGSVGSIYNQTPGNLFVGFKNNGARGLPTLCYIPSGGSAPYSVVEQTTGRGDDKIETLTLSTNARAGDGVCAVILDQEYGYPGTLLINRRYGGCETVVSASRNEVDVAEQITTLSEGESTEMRLGNAFVIANRLDDDADAAKKWTGSDAWNVRDWARIDLTVKSL
jgi:hypothetical protein